MYRTINYVRVAGLLTGFCAVLGLPSGLRADGGFFFGQAADLSQVRQEAILAVHPDGTAVTYVLRSLYDGESSEFAWVLPVPATPTDVVAHEDSSIFLDLDRDTRPRFLILPTSGGGGCACGATGGPLGSGTIAEVEASGKAGVFDWFALTSSGSAALLGWLGSNGFDVPPAAGPVLDDYIAQGMHFLAVRVHESVAAEPGHPSEIPPIQFTVATTRRFYPMTISQVSAGDDTEVILYVLGPHRAEASNLPNGLIDPATLAADFTSGSLTNYEGIFTQKIAELGGLALITEYASATTTGQPAWPDIPAALAGQALYLTRMRTVISREHMTQDFELRDAADDTDVSNAHTVTDAVRAAAAVGQLMPAIAVIGVFLGMLKRRQRRVSVG